MDGHQYEVVRSKVYNGAHKLSLFIDGNDQSSSVKETQARIIDILHADFDTFCDTILIAQGKSSSFMEKPADKRKDTFIQILRLDEYDTLAEYTKSLKKELASKLTNKRERLTLLEKYISYEDEYNLQLTSFNEELTNIDIQSLEDKVSQLTITISNINTIKDKNNVILSERKRLTNLVNELKNKIQLIQTNIDNIQCDDNIDNYSLKVDKLTKENKSLQEQINDLQQQINQINIQFSLYKNELDIKKKKINDIKQYNKAVCEFCGTEITNEHKQKHVKELVDSGNVIFAKAKELKSQLIILEEQLSNLKNQFNSNQQQIDKLNREINNISLALAKKKNYETNLADAKNNLQAAQDSLQDNLKLVIEDVEDINFNEFNLLKNELNSKKSRKNKLNESIAVLKDRLEQIVSFKEEYNSLLVDISDLDKKLEDYNAIIHAFSKNGIQSYIIENALPEIEDEINSLLSELTADKISIQFITTKETKAKTSIDTLDILVNDNGNIRKYETFSGGEKFRIDFASHVGLARFLGRRSNSALNMFILDENLGSQDETAKAIFVQCISKMTQHFDQIIIITHINDIKDAFQHKIEVVKDSKKGSLINIVN